MRREILLTVILTCVRFISSVRSGDPKSAPKNATSVKDTNRRILFGHPADPLNFKYLVQLQKNGQHICGASIIRSDWVLTATHCIITTECSDIKIVPATMMDPEIRPDISAIECHTHEQYQTQKVSYDMAVIKVDQDLLQFEGKTEVIPLPQPSKVFRKGLVGTMVGWGETEDRKPSDGLLTATAPVVDYATCLQDWKNWQNPDCQFDSTTCNAYGIPRRSICVQGDKFAPAGICLGDSGGPLVVENILAGISTVVLAVPDGKCTLGAPAVFTSTVDFLPWIYQFTDPDKDTSKIFVQPEIYT